MILQKYASDHHFPNPCFYVDDGYSGASLQHPGFQQMMADMENGEIGIIITKDLSRLGRNQLHTGLYIEERFPMFGVRYIAINDNVDTDSGESTAGTRPATTLAAAPISGSDACISHYIRECILDDVVLEDLRQVTAMAREHTKEFAEYIGSRQSREIQRKSRRLR